MRLVHAVESPAQRFAGHGDRFVSHVKRGVSCGHSHRIMPLIRLFVQLHTPWLDEYKTSARNEELLDLQGPGVYSSPDMGHMPAWDRC
jgi:hypothetical protein